MLCHLPPQPLPSRLEGSCLFQSGFSSAAFLKHLVREAEGPPWCLPPPGLLPAHLTQDMVPAVTLGVPTETLSPTKSTVPSPPALIVPCSTPLQEHSVSEKHHPLEPDHSLHPTQCHVVRGAAHHEPRGAREQCGKCSSASLSPVLSSCDVQGPWRSLNHKMAWV